MNLFLLDLNVEQSVAWHVDDHVNKIALEALQVMSAGLFFRAESFVSFDASAWYKHGLWNTEGRRSVARAYSPTHVGHPMSKWCMEPVNYMWTLWYVVQLCKEHKHRHGTIIQQWNVVSQMPRFDVPRDQLPTTFYAAVAEELCTADELRAGKMVTPERAVELYHLYYRQHKSHLHRWTKRERPSWL